MFFSLSKIFAFLIDPLVWLFFIAWVALLKTGLPRFFRRVLWLGLALIYLASAPAAGGKLVAAYERLVQPSLSQTSYDAAVVLSGIVQLPLSNEQNIEFSSGVERILSAMELVRSGRCRYLVISGGSGELFGPTKLEADLLKSFAIRMGLDRQRIIIDSFSRNTRENAVETEKILKRENFHSFVLVTSAMHMFRARGCFRAEGLRPDLLPVDYRAEPVNWRDFRTYLPHTRVLRLFQAMLHEVVGSLIYWLKGYFVI